MSASEAPHDQTSSSPMSSNRSKLLTAVNGDRRTLLIAVSLGIAAAAVYLWISVGQYARLETPSWDLAIFTQLAKAYAGYSVPIVDIKGYGFNLLGDHFHPILIVLGPIYRMWPSPVAVMAVQDALLGLSVGIITWFGTRHLGWLRGICLGAAFAMSFGMLEAVRVQFHEVAFAVPLLSASLCLAAVGRIRPALWWAAPLVFVKEDLGLTVAVIGLVCAWRAAGGSWRLIRTTPDARRALLLTVWGLVWMVLAVLVILPGLNPQGQFDYGDRLDIAAILGDPLLAFSDLFQPWTKTATWLTLIVTGALVFLCSPLALVGLPTLVWRFLSSNEGYWETTWHYNLVLMPMLFAALFDAALAAERRRAQRFAEGLPAESHSSSVQIQWRAMAETATRLGPVAAAVVAVFFLPSSPLAGELEARAHDDTPAAQEQLAHKRAAIRQIPEGALVAADLSVITPLVPEHRVLWIGRESDPAPQFLVWDQRGSTWHGKGPEDPLGYARRVYEAEYQVHSEHGDIIVLERQGGSAQ